MSSPTPFRRSLGFAVAGVVEAVRTQRNMRIHVVSGLLVAHVLMGAPLPGWAQVALVSAVAAVLFAELLNTSLEALVDLASPGRDERARIAKDAAAGAVLVLSIGAALVLAMVVASEAATIFADAWLIQRQVVLGVPQVLAATAPTLLPQRWAQNVSATLAVALGLACASFSQSVLGTGLLFALTALAAAAQRRA